MSNPRLLTEKIKEILNDNLNRKSPDCAEGDYIPLFDDEELLETASQIAELTRKEIVWAFARYLQRKTSRVRLAEEIGMNFYELDTALKSGS